MGFTLEDLYQVCKLNDMDPKETIVTVSVGDSYYDFDVKHDNVTFTKNNGVNVIELYGRR